MLVVRVIPVNKSTTDYIDYNEKGQKICVIRGSKPYAAKVESM
jgi:hypothetical protein